MNIVLLPPLFLPPTEYFRLIADADMAVIDTGLSFDKRFKAVHRTVVAGSAGETFLTVPVSRPESSLCPWSDVRVSGHGEWFRVQRLTLATLFGPTPWFDLYRHDIFPLIGESAVGRRITDLDIDLVMAVCRLSGIRTPMSVTLDPRYADDTDVRVDDFRPYDFYGKPGAVSVLETLFTQGKV